MNNKVEVKQTKKYGRGLFATRTIQKGEVVEISPIVELIGNNHATTSLNVYVFEWKNNSSALALGLGSLFNHSKRANVTYNPVFQNRNIIFVATKKIKPGNQLFINYGYDPKYGIEVTERALFSKLKQKFEPDVDKFDGHKGLLSEEKGRMEKNEISKAKEKYEEKDKLAESN